MGFPSRLKTCPVGGVEENKIKIIKHLINTLSAIEGEGRPRGGGDYIYSSSSYYVYAFSKKERNLRKEM